MSEAASRNEAVDNYDSVSDAKTGKISQTHNSAYAHC